MPMIDGPSNTSSQYSHFLVNVHHCTRLMLLGFSDYFRLEKCTYTTLLYYVGQSSIVSDWLIQLRFINPGIPEPQSRDPGYPWNWSNPGIPGLWALLGTSSKASANIEKTKQQYWQRTADRISDNGVSIRPWRMVRKKWQDISPDARKWKQSFSKTGGGSMQASHRIPTSFLGLCLRRVRKVPFMNDR